MKTKLILLLILPFIYTSCTKTIAPTPVLASHTTSQSAKISLNAGSDIEIESFEDEFSSNEAQTLSPENDPLYGYNTAMTNFNDGFITYALNPVSRAYGYVIPQPLRIGISNAIKNINFPVRFINNLLQGKWRNSTEEFTRFVFNSTLGLGGLIDVSTNAIHIPAHKEDFGQTLGYYGVGAGYHIVLPFFGPSNVRDFVGLSVDAYASPLINIRGLEAYKIPNNFAQSTAIVAGSFINKNSLELGQYESLKKDALELYPFLRDIYEQKRTADIEE